MIEASGEIRIRYPSMQEALYAAAALAPENGGHLTTRVEGDSLVLMLPERKISSTLHTVDDALACLTAADAVARTGAKDPLSFAKRMPPPDIDPDEWLAQVERDRDSARL